MFPGYIRRVEEESRILAEAEQVRADGCSRVVLVYGTGGTGKTMLLRQMASTHSEDSPNVWLSPIDVDDSDYWLLSNLELSIANELDPENRFFVPFREYLARLPMYSTSISREAVVSHLGAIKEVFVDCYRNFVIEAGKTVLLVLDTVEAIRGTSVLLTLTQWMKSLPSTLFVLSARPSPFGDVDPIISELENPHQPLPVTTIHLGAFTEADSHDYLRQTAISDGVAPEEQTKIVHLTRGHPLWLALSVDYLKTIGVPQELERHSVSEIVKDLPYGKPPTPRGQSLQESFIRRLLAPYMNADFWHEAVKRLAVVRQSVDLGIWEGLMADLPLPRDTATLDDAWQRLLQTPWIRSRSNRRFVTLHDAMAEQLAQRIIPLHDQDRSWRREIWARAADICRAQAEEAEPRLAADLAELEERLRDLVPQDAEPGTLSAKVAERRELVRKVAELEGWKRELDRFTVASLVYQLLIDFREGCRRLVELFEQTGHAHDRQLQDLLALEIQRFLPIGSHPYALNDVVGEVVAEFRTWLLMEAPETYLVIGLGLGAYLIENEEPAAALELLDGLPLETADHHQRYRLDNLRASACMRTPGRVKDALTHLTLALDEAEGLQAPDRLMYIAAAHKELGYFYRCTGRWREAEAAYQRAWDAMSVVIRFGASDDDRRELAEIQAFWAYVKGFSGGYRDASNLVESAITVNRRFNDRQREGSALSIYGEILRYERRFERAWRVYREAELIFESQRSWSMLGVLYQEQAICLVQAAEDEINLAPWNDPAEQARRLISRSMDICRNHALRSYPSALNRAGRIFALSDVDVGLRYLNEGIEWARRLSDGWFWAASLMEYLELIYRAWIRERSQARLAEIAEHREEIELVLSDYDLPEIRGRWEILQGHLGIHGFFESGEKECLLTAREAYATGFASLAREYRGSSGAAAIRSEFLGFAQLFRTLPDDVRQEWMMKLRQSWSRTEAGAPLLLARLEELY